MLNKIKEEQYKVLDVADLLEENGENTIAEQLRINVRNTLKYVESIKKELVSAVSVLSKAGKKIKRKPKYNVSKKPKMLTEQEVLEIEEYIDKCRDLNVKPDYKYIMKKYNISNTIFYKISNHTHKYSSIREI